MPSHRALCHTYLTKEQCSLCINTAKIQLKKDSLPNLKNMLTTQYTEIENQMVKKYMKRHSTLVRIKRVVRNLTLPGQLPSTQKAQTLPWELISKLLECHAWQKCLRLPRDLVLVPQWDLEWELANRLQQVIAGYSNVIKDYVPTWVIIV